MRTGSRPKRSISTTARSSGPIPSKSAPTAPAAEMWRAVGTWWGIRFTPRLQVVCVWCGGAGASGYPSNDGVSFGQAEAPAPPEPLYMTAKELFDAGDLPAAIAKIGDELKNDPADTRRRIFLFEMLCLAGDLERATKQLDAIARGGTDSELAVQQYRGAVQCGKLRRLC